MGVNFPPSFGDVLALLDGGQNGRVRRRAADAALFQFFHQRRFVVARRRLGEVLLRLQFLQSQLLARLERRQLVLQLLVFLVLAFLGLFVDFQEAVELHDRSGDAEPVAVVALLGVDVDRGLIEDRRHYLRRDEALPDQLVDLELVFVQVLLERSGCAHHRRSDESLRALPARLSST